MKWSIEPSDGVTNNGDGSFTFPKNASITQYTVICDNEAGCTAKTIYNLPVDCGGKPDPPQPGICDYFIVDSGSYMDVEVGGGDGCDSAWIAAEGKPIFNEGGVTSDTCDWIDINPYRWGIDPPSKMCSLYSAYPSVAQRLMVLAKIDEAASSPVSTDECKWSRSDTDLCIQTPSDKKTDPYFVDKGIIMSCEHPSYPDHAWEYHPPLSVYPQAVQDAVNNVGDYANKLGTVEYTVKPNTTGQKRSCVITWYVNNVECKSKTFTISQKGEGSVTPVITINGREYTGDDNPIPKDACEAGSLAFSITEHLRYTISPDNGVKINNSLTGEVNRGTHTIDYESVSDGETKETTITFTNDNNETTTLNLKRSCNVVVTCDKCDDFNITIITRSEVPSTGRTRTPVLTFSTSCEPEEGFTVAHKSGDSFLDLGDRKVQKV
jgi:hypothetical protein